MKSFSQLWSQDYRIRIHKPEYTTPQRGSGRRRSRSAWVRPYIIPYSIRSNRAGIPRNSLVSSARNNSL